MPQQLSLNVTLNEETTFANFTAMSANQAALAALASFATGAGEKLLCVWGPSGAGVSHLLQAVCHRASAAALHAQYLPLAELKGYPPAAVLEGLEYQHLICVDDLDQAAGSPQWEEALFHCYNRCKDSGRGLLLGASQNPVSLPFQLPDLSSRVLGTLRYSLAHLDDEHLAQALKARAQALGLELGDDVAKFLLHRVARNSHKVFALLAELDAASLREQRRLTVPFVKQVLGG